MRPFQIAAGVAVMKSDGLHTFSKVVGYAKPKACNYLEGTVQNSSTLESSVLSLGGAKGPGGVTIYNPSYGTQLSHVH